MDSLDAQLRWNTKRDAVFKKIATRNERITPMPQRNKVKIRIRPGEILREDFATWMGDLAPESGAVNEFRTKMYQSELRGLHNRIKVNTSADRTNRIMQHAESAPAPPRFPGIQLFFQNTVDQSPLPGLRGSGLTQLPRTMREYRDVNEDLRKNLRQQVADLTAMRAGQPVPVVQPPILTALDEAKLQIGTQIETIAQQVLRGIFTSEILRELTAVSTTIARNAPLMDAPALGELMRYVADMGGVIRANAKNTGKEVAEENLLAFDDDATQFFDIYATPTARNAQSRDLDKGVKADAKVAEAIYARVEALADFLRKQFDVADRAVPERIQVARASLPALGTNIDRKSYPTDVRKRLNLEETQRAQAEAPTMVGEVLPPAVVSPPMVAPTLDVRELAGLEGAPAMRPAPAIEDAFADLTDVETLIAQADEANARGDTGAELMFVRRAYRALLDAGEEERAGEINRLAQERGIDVMEAESAPASASASARESASASAPPASQFPVPIVITSVELDEIKTEFATLLGVPVDELTSASTVPRKSEAIKNINAIMKGLGIKPKITQSKGSISLGKVFDTLGDRNAVIADDIGDLNRVSASMI